jgi:Right handed beta helix region
VRRHQTIHSSKRRVVALAQAIIPCVLSYATLSAPASAAAGDAVIPGTPRVTATFESLGLYWPITGDANQNASMTLEFRQTGETVWRAGATAMKAEPTTIVDGAPLNRHHLAASAMLLSPGAAYELRATISDPDGGGTQQVIWASTRTEPTANVSGRVRLVVPGSGGGDGTASNPFLGAQAAANAAVPGDIFTLGAGTYAPFSITTSGTAANPIVFRGPPGGGAIIDGANTNRGVVTVGSIGTGGSHIIVEGLTIQNGFWGIDADSTSNITIRRNTIRNVGFGVVNRREFGAEGNQTIVDNVISGRTPWPGTGIPEEQGIELRGEGNVVGYNTISNFGDCISIQPRTNVSNGNDVVGNSTDFCVDDGIQIDFNTANVRVWRNRVSNSRMGVSVQPIYGGPAYIFRNEFFNLENNPIKMNNNPSGFIVVHNTSVKNGPALSDPPEVWRNAIYRNNLMLGTGYALELVSVADTGFRDFDYDAWGSTRAATAGEPWFKWNNVRYATLAALQAVGVETHGIAVGFADLNNATLPSSWDVAVAPETRDLKLKPGSAAINRGTALANFNDGFVTDGNPDMGAFEAGQTAPVYGPRSTVTPPTNEPSRFVPFGPTRQFDTRTGAQGGRHPGGLATRVYTLPDVPAGATAVTMNVTAVSPSASGYLSVFPCGTVPSTSTLNYQTERIATPNQVTVAVSTRQVCVQSLFSTDIIMDLAGWWLPGAEAQFGAAQQRLWDTRTQGGGQAGSVLVLDLAGLAVPNTVGVSINVTSTASTAPGFLTVYDCATTKPLASNVNFDPGVTAANHATIALRSTARRLCVYASASTAIVVDLTGWWVTGGTRTLRTLTVPDRRLDTRATGSTVGKLVPNQTVQIQAASANTLFVNVTVDQGASDGYVAVFPCAAGWQGTSTVNYRAGIAIANAAIVDGTSGVCARSNQSVHIIFDVFAESANT